MTHSGHWGCLAFRIEGRCEQAEQKLKEIESILNAPEKPVLHDTKSAWAIIWEAMLVSVPSPPEKVSS
jgi:hypothetical protein